METIGRVLHQAWWYDVLAWLWTGGKERAFRERIVALASPASGERVLDIGCGTGTLAIAVKKCIGVSGEVVGVDASREMVERARLKARRAAAQITFEQAVAESLPFPDGQFDVVFSTLMLHHLPAKARKQCLSETRRVLKSNGRLIVVDFETSGDDANGIIGLLHRRRHGHVAQENIAALLAGSKLDVLRSGRVGYGDVHFTIAVPASAG